MFFDGSFLKKKRNSVYSFISICLSDLKDQKFYLPSGLTNGQGSLPVAIMARRLLMSKPDSCEIISKSDQRFLKTRFFKNFFMSV